jgi:very-short-patch-repair endonuclease
LANENARALRKRLTPQEVKLWVKLRELKPLGYHFRDKHRSGITSSTSFRSDTNSLSKQTAASTECPMALG